MKSAAVVLSSFIALTPVPSAHAEQPLKVGSAELIHNEVLDVGGAQLVPVNVGDEIVRDETLRTGAESQAKIGLVDDTKLSLGPASTLTIDRAVYSGEKSYREIFIKLSAGTFRFITGHSEKKSYKIETPTATIGVRGTVLDIRVDENQTLVSLQNGQASVCAAGRCTQLLKKGHTANVLRNGNGIEIRRELTPSWTFASVCGGNVALCGSELPGNVLKKANLNNLPAGVPSRTNRIVLFCPNGMPMTGGKCGPSDVASGNLPLLNDPQSPQINSPVIDPPLQRSGIDTRQVAPLSVPGLSLPGLRR